MIYYLGCSATSVPILTSQRACVLRFRRHGASGCLPRSGRRWKGWFLGGTRRRSWFGGHGSCCCLTGSAMTIVRLVGKSKVTVWRWQERYLAKGIAGLRRDATRPGRKPPLSAEVIGLCIRPCTRRRRRRRIGASARWPVPSPQLHQRAAGLEGARPQAAPGEDLQAVE